MSDKNISQIATDYWEAYVGVVPKKKAYSIKGANL